MPRASKPLIRTMRVEGRPSAPTVASVIAFGSGSCAGDRLLEPGLELLHRVGRRRRLRRARRARSSCAGRRCRSSAEYRKAPARARPLPRVARRFGIVPTRTLGGRPYVDLPLPRLRAALPSSPHGHRNAPSIVLAAGKGSRFAAGWHKLAQPLGDSERARADARRARSPASCASSSSRRRPSSTSRAAASRRATSSSCRRSATMRHAGLGMGALDRRRRERLARFERLAGAARRHAAGAAGDPARGGARARRSIPVAYAQHRGRRGHPVGFAAELYSGARRAERRRRRAPHRRAAIRPSPSRSTTPASWSTSTPKTTSTPAARLRRADAGGRAPIAPRR